jgi:myo-inositol-1(or 4)-monophosphatase
MHNALLTTGFTYRKDEWLKQEMSAFERLSEIARAIRRPGSAALDLAYTARGVFDGFWERRLSPWDIAAGIVLVTEAGGQVSDFQGNPYKLDGGELLASNSRLHPALLDSVGRI